MARKPKAETPDATPMLALIDQDAPDETALVVVQDAPPEVQARRAASIVLLQPERFDQFYERMKAETSAHVPDVSTAAGRDAIRSLAFRVTKTKTTLAAAALDLTADWRSRTKAVNDARGPIVSRLDALADEVRAPLTAWENAEAERVAANQATLAAIRNAATVADDDTSATVEARGREEHARTFPAPQWSEDEAAEAEGAKQATVQALVAARNRLRKEEADAAELEALRAERAEREAREARELAERQEREAAEAAERERQEAERQAREDAERREREEAERLERERQAAADRARREAEEAAAEREREAARERAAEQARRDAEHAEQLAAERRERERLEREAREREEAAEAECQRALADARERERIAAEEAEAERKRQASRTHRSNVQREVKEALMTCGLDEEQARKVVLAIVAGNVPHCAVSF